MSLLSESRTRLSQNPESELRFNPKIDYQSSKVPFKMLPKRRGLTRQSHSQGQWQTIWGPLFTLGPCLFFVIIIILCLAVLFVWGFWGVGIVDLLKTCGQELECFTTSPWAASRKELLPICGDCSTLRHLQREIHEKWKKPSIPCLNILCRLGRMYINIKTHDTGKLHDSFSVI